MKKATNKPLGDSLDFCVRLVKANAALSRRFDGRLGTFLFLSKRKGDAFLSVDDLFDPAEIPGVADYDLRCAQRRSRLRRQQVGMAGAYADHEKAAFIGHRALPTRGAAE